MSEHKSKRLQRDGLPMLPPTLEQQLERITHAHDVMSRLADLIDSSLPDSFPWTWETVETIPVPRNEPPPADGFYSRFWYGYEGPE